MLKLDELKSTSWMTLIGIITVTLLPGYLLIFLFDKELFFDLEFFKLLFLSMSITTPIWIINNLFCINMVEKDDNPDEESLQNSLQQMALLGAICTIPVLYIPVLVKIFIDISPFIGFCIALVLQILMATLLIKMSSKEKAQS